MQEKMWVIIKLMIFLLLSCDCRSLDHTNTCIIPIGNLDYHWPLVFNRYFELYPTSTAAGNGGHTLVMVNIEDGDDVYFSCAPNYLKNFNQKNLIKAKCLAATNEFSYEALKIFNISELGCNTGGAMQEVNTKVTGCDGLELTGSQFGYVAIGETSKRAVMVAEVCYDVTQGSTRFAHIKLGGPGASELEQTTIDIFRNPTYTAVSYKLDFFRALAFDMIFKSVDINLNGKGAQFYVTENYIDNSLLPHTQFQSIKTLGWNYFNAHEELQVLKTLRADIRKVAEARAIDVYIGSHGVKVLHGNGLEQTEVYLQQNGGKRRFPMPAVIWLLVIEQQRATGFIVLNDLVADEREFTAQHGINCENVCGKLPWLKQTMVENVERSGLLCCTYEELKAAIEVPHLIDIEGLFV